MWGQSTELVNDVFQGNVGEGGRREWAGNKGDLVHCTAWRQRRIGEGRGTRVPGEERQTSRSGKAYRCGGGRAIVCRRHVFGKGMLCKWDGEGLHLV